MSNGQTAKWARFVAELATMPDVVERLAAAHVPDSHGRCRACTTPGRGTPATRWPCGCASLASAAIALLHRRRAG